MSDGKEVPIGQHNSVTLPARFVLELHEEMPLESSKCQDIINITGIDFLPSNQKATPMLQLVTRQYSNGILDSSNNRGMFVVSFRFNYVDYIYLCSIYIVLKIPGILIKNYLEFMKFVIILYLFISKNRRKYLVMIYF